MTVIDNEMRSNEELIGRADLNDLEAIFATKSVQEADGLHPVKDNCEAVFTWNYEKGERPALDKLYEKAKRAQWNGNTDLPWETEVDPEAEFMKFRQANPGMSPLDTADLTGTCFAKWGEKEKMQMGIESQNWMLSQFTHGEQGALLCTAKIVETVPWIDAKYYAATQVVDEARHVEVFSRYLETKLGGIYSLNPHLGMLLDDIIADSRWDMTYLGMQIMVEGLALAAFGLMHATTQEPLLKKLLRYVMADEARHVAFGVLSLQDFYKDLNAAEIRERQEFAFEAAVRMRDRMQQQEVFERMGVPVKDAIHLLSQDGGQRDFQILLFSKIVPNCKKLGLLDAADGWLRTKFSEIGVIAFEDFEDTTQDEDVQAEGSPVDRELV